MLCNQAFQKVTRTETVISVKSFLTCLSDPHCSNAIFKSSKKQSNQFVHLDMYLFKNTGVARNYKKVRQKGLCKCTLEKFNKYKYLVSQWNFDSLTVLIVMQKYNWNNMIHVSLNCGGFFLSSFPN